MLEFWNSLKWTQIPLDAKNRMLRVGFGLHEGKWFIRTDLWFAGYRVSQ